ncbi:MAG: LacI family DNA-binding transcriptional regulator [Roseibium sp.]
MGPKTVRISDVAKAAGVSTATVSRAISNPELLTEGTRDVVFEAIRSTGYRVNKAARNLRKRQAGAVLILVPNLGNPFFSQIIAGMSEAFAERDYSILVADTTRNRPGDGKFMDYFLDSRVDGMICLDGGLTFQDFSQVEANGMADRVVFACEWVTGVPFPSVRSDNVEGARLAVRHLYDLGHRKIAHITGPQDNILTGARRQGMVEERARLDLPVRDEWIIRGDFSLESGREAAKTILQMENRPTAVFCASDQVAFGLISYLTANGVRVPEDMSVVGFDDIELSECFVPALTTIRQDRPALGFKAASLLLDCLDGNTRPEQSIEPVVLDVELVVRQSATTIS